MIMEKDFYQVSLKAIIKNNRGEILALEADFSGTMKGFYDLPGGRIDAGEFTVSFSEIIKREIFEEVGNIEFNLNPKPVAIGRHLIPASISKSGSDIHVLYLFFEAEYLTGQIFISNEHTGFKWVDLLKETPEKLFTSGILEGVKMYLKIKDQE